MPGPRLWPRRKEGKNMLIRTILLISSAFALLALPVSTPNAEIVEYDLPDLTGEYDGNPHHSTPGYKIAYIAYEGMTARLEHFKIYLNGHGRGTQCWSDYTGELLISDPLWIFMRLSKPGHDYFYDNNLFTASVSPEDFEKEIPLKWYYTGGEGYNWYEEIILNPGDSLRVYMFIGGGPDWLYCSYSEMTLYDVHVWLDMNESIVPVDQTTWGRIKAIYHNSR
jgi:hypothetical protein